MRKLHVVPGVLVAAALVVAACSGTTTPTIQPINVPTLPPINLPTLPPINLPTLPPINLPSFPIGSSALPSFAIPSFNTSGDPQLAAKFPTTIAGQPVTGVQTFRLMDLFNAFGQTEQSQTFSQAMVALGVDPNTVTTGSAQATVNNNNDSIEAFRAPGVSASQFLSVLPQVAVALDPTQSQPTVGQTNIGGKTVTTFTDPTDGSITYYYPSGDIIWSTNATDPADVAVILAALQ
jgi:hypothetical protein